MYPLPYALTFCGNAHTRPAGLAVNHDRPDSKLPYDGKWLWLGAQGTGGGMIHLMVLPNPDPTAGRPEHGGRDRHTCVEVTEVEPLKEALDRAGRREGNCSVKACTIATTPRCQLSLRLALSFQQ